MAPTDESDDAGGFVPPLPPEDRLWRHPSEMVPNAQDGPAPAFAAASPAATEDSPTRRGQRQAMVLAAVAGVVVTLGVLAAVGTFNRDGVTVAVERVAIEPADDPTAVDLLGPALARLDTLRDGQTTATTAVVYRPDGYLLVMADAVEPTAALTITLSDGRVLSATLVGSDPMSGIAVVRVEADGLTSAVLGGEGAAKPGDTAVAISHAPDPATSPVVAQGQVTGTGWRLDGESGTRHGLIRAALGSSPPSTGGAVLCSPTGTVLGVLLPDEAGSARPLPNASEDATTPTVLTTTAGGAAAAHFATPISLAVRVADELVATGRAHYAWLGVQGDDLDADRAATLGRSGAMLTGVDAGGPADRAGLRSGDLVTSLDDQPVRSISELVIALRGRRPGDEVTLGVSRGSDVRSVVVTLSDSAE